MVGPVIFDAIKRYLAYSGYKVTLVVNITDVDDKLIAESSRRGMPMSQLAAEMTADYMNNLGALGVDVIDHFPRCTETIDEIIEFTKTLVEKGFAYEAAGRRVLRGGQVPRLRQAEPSRRRGHAGRRRRHGRAEAEPAPISPCGNRPSPASPPGPAPGDPAGPAGTSNAPP